MELKFILEAILFSAQKPLSLKEIRDVFALAPDHAEGNETVRGLKKPKEDQLMSALEELAKEHEAANRSYRLACVAGSWQFVTQPDYAPWLKALVGHKARPPRLSQPALETLAIIAYRQPLTRTEIEQVRGVAVDGVMQTLVERGLVEQVGRAEVVGRPMTYGTTPVFLEYFGLRSLEELPSADELRRIPVEKPEPLAAAEPELPVAAGDQPAAPAPEQQPPAEAPKPAEAPVAAAEANPAEPAPAEAQPEAAPAPEAEAAAPEASPANESPAAPEPTSPPEEPQS